MATHAIGPRPVPPREVTVEISVQKGEIHVNVEGQPKPFWVRKRDNQEVRWVLKGGGEFLVDFKNDSPFYESQFSQESPVSGLVRRDILPSDSRLYKYTVFIPNVKELDPGGGVKP
jgi:hypothetical protein